MENSYLIAGVKVRVLILLLCDLKKNYIADINTIAKIHNAYLPIAKKQLQNYIVAVLKLCKFTWELKKFQKTLRQTAASPKYFFRILAHCEIFSTNYKYMKSKTVSNCMFFY